MREVRSRYINLHADDGFRKLFNADYNKDLAVDFLTKSRTDCRERR